MHYVNEHGAYDDVYQSCDEPAQCMSAAPLKRTCIISSFHSQHFSQSLENLANRQSNAGFLEYSRIASHCKPLVLYS